MQPDLPITSVLGIAVASSCCLSKRVKRSNCAGWCCRLAVLATKHAVLSAPSQGPGVTPAWTHREFLPQPWSVSMGSFKSHLAYQIISKMQNPQSACKSTIRLHNLQLYTGASCDGEITSKMHNCKQTAENVSAGHNERIVTSHQYLALFYDATLERDVHSYLLSKAFLLDTIVMFSNGHRFLQGHVQRHSPLSL